MAGVSIYLTEQQVKLLLHMISIAEAGDWGEGDYGWSEEELEAAVALGVKVTVAVFQRDKDRETRARIDALGKEDDER